MNHPNICGLKAYFYTQGDTKVNIYIIIQMLGWREDIFNSAVC